MNEGIVASSTSFSPQLIELKNKLIQPTVLSFPEPHLNHIDTQKLKIPKKQSLFTPERDPKYVERALLNSIQSKKQDAGGKGKRSEKLENPFISRQRYILPPVNNIRKVLKNNSSLYDKSQPMINSYVHKDLIRLVTPLKKQIDKSYNSSSHLDNQLQTFLKNSKSRSKDKSKRIVYYRPEQARRNYLQKEVSGLMEIQNSKHFKSEMKLGVVNALRKRTKTQLKSHSIEQFDFFKLTTCFNKPQYVTFDSISNQKSSNSSRLSLNQRVLHCPKQQQLKEFLTKYDPINEEIQIKSLLKSNFCSVQFSKHEVYVGQMVGKLRSGMGILFTCEDCFEGLWKSNNKIRGVEITKEGVYKGHFQGNLRDGKGEFQWGGGEVYVGDWIKGCQHGQGLWVNSRGQSYKGEWRLGKADGIGSLIIKNTQHSKSGRKYKGAFVNNKQHGFGRESFPNGDSYEGMYRQDKPFGRGTYIWANGSIYEGQFYEGTRMGMGVLKTSFNLIYKGEFRDDCPDGECEIILPNGDTYYGMVKDGMKNGKGTLRIQKSKETFNGYWKDDYFVGHQKEAPYRN